MDKIEQDEKAEKIACMIIDAAREECDREKLFLGTVNADEVLRKHISAYLAATTCEPVGYIDKHRQKFASADAHTGSSLAKSGWTPVFTTPPAAPTYRDAVKFTIRVSTTALASLKATRESA